MSENMNGIAYPVRFTLTSSRGRPQYGSRYLSNIADNVRSTMAITKLYCVVQNVSILE